MRTRRPIPAHVKAGAKLKKALRKYDGGQTGLARVLNVSQGLVWQWTEGRVRILENYCPAIEREVGVRCEVLRPDLIWTRNEHGQVTGHHVPLQGAA